MGFFAIAQILVDKKNKILQFLPAGAVSAILRKASLFVRHSPISAGRNLGIVV